MEVHNLWFLMGNSAKEKFNGKYTVVYSFSVNQDKIDNEWSGDGTTPTIVAFAISGRRQEPIVGGSE